MFSVDARIDSSCFFLGDWPLSRVLLKNEAHYPWFILVPRREHIQELYQLTHEERLHLMEEVHQLSLLVQNYFTPDKLNVGAIGNRVPQLHVHVVARTKNDGLWPDSVWQASLHTTPYTQEHINTLVPVLRGLVTSSIFDF